MRKLMLAAVGLAACVTAGLAVAHGVEGRTARSLAGTFTATTASSTTTKTCTTTAGKAITTTKARYSGTASGDADLAGPITLDVRSVVNTTDGVGVVEGSLRIDVASGRDTTARFSAVFDHGRLAGLASGHARDPGATLLANLSAGFSATGGFTDGKIGSTAGGAAVALSSGRCEPKQQRAPVERSEARGTVSALSATSITVGGLTCAVPAGLAAKVSAFKVGDRAEIRCSLVNGQNTLVKIKRKRR
jgi:hypothetical protein